VGSGGPAVGRAAACTDVGWCAVCGGADAGGGALSRVTPAGCPGPGAAARDGLSGVFELGVSGMLGQLLGTAS